MPGHGTAIDELPPDVESAEVRLERARTEAKVAFDRGARREVPCHGPGIPEGLAQRDAGVRLAERLVEPLLPREGADEMRSRRGAPAGVATRLGPRKRGAERRLGTRRVALEQVHDAGVDEHLACEPVVAKGVREGEPERELLDGIGVPPRVQLEVAEVLVGDGLSTAISRRALDREGLREELAGAASVPELERDSAEVRERDRAALVVTDLDLDRERLVAQPPGLLVLRALPVAEPHVGDDARFEAPVGEAARDGTRIFLPLPPLGGPSLVLEHAAHHVECPGFPAPVHQRAALVELRAGRVQRCGDGARQAQAICTFRRRGERGEGESDHRIFSRSAAASAR
ncbi:MAG: hypothetical protein U0166_23090 [Acidobacteriota bacterium]